MGSQEEEEGSAKGTENRKAVSFGRKCILKAKRRKCNKNEKEITWVCTAVVQVKVKTECLEK